MKGDLVVVVVLGWVEYLLCLGTDWLFTLVSHVCQILGCPRTLDIRVGRLESN